MWVLRLNDMRFPQVEILHSVAKATAKDTRSLARAVCTDPIDAEDNHSVQKRLSSSCARARAKASAEVAKTPKYPGPTGVLPQAVPPAVGAEHAETPRHELAQRIGVGLDVIGRGDHRPALRAVHRFHTFDPDTFDLGRDAFGQGPALPRRADPAPPRLRRCARTAPERDLAQRRRLQRLSRDRLDEGALPELRPQGDRLRRLSLSGFRAFRRSGGHRPRLPSLAGSCALRRLCGNGVAGAGSGFRLPPLWRRIDRLKTAHLRFQVNGDVPVSPFLLTPQVFASR